MSTKWTTNENPVASSKLNKLCIIHLTTADRTALGSSDVIFGQIIRDITDGNYYEVSGISPVTFKKLGKSLGGGGGVVNLIGYYRYGSYIAQIGHYLFPTTPIGRSQVSSNSWTGNQSPLATTSGSANFVETVTLAGYKGAIDLGKPIDKIYLTFAFALRAIYSVSQAMTLTVNSVKFDIYDGVTLKTTKTITMNESRNVTSSDQTTGHIVHAEIDIGSISIADLQIKITIDSTVTATNLLSHYHYWYGDVESSSPGTGNFHPLEVQAVLGA